MNKLHNLLEKEEFLEASLEELRVLVAYSELGTVNADELASVCKISRARAASALSFWREAKVITDSTATITEEFEERLRQGEIDEEPSRKVALDIRNNELAELISECAAIMNKSSFSTTEVKKLTALVTQYSLSEEYILTLAAYLADKRKLTVTRLTDEALKLVGRDVDTAEALIEYVKERENESVIEKEFRKLLGIYNRSLTEREKAYFKKWSEEYGYFIDVVGEAYDICVSATSKLSLAYMDKILTAWHEASCRTLAECRKKSEEERLKKLEEKKKKQAKKQPSEEKTLKYGSFDVKDAFKKALERSYKKDEN